MTGFSIQIFKVFTNEVFQSQIEKMKRQGCIDFAGKIIEIIGWQKQRAKCCDIIGAKYA